MVSFWRHFWGGSGCCRWVSAWVSFPIGTWCGCCPRGPELAHWLLFRRRTIICFTLSWPRDGNPWHDACTKYDQIWCYYLHVSLGAEYLLALRTAHLGILVHFAYYYYPDSIHPHYVLYKNFINFRNHTSLSIRSPHSLSIVQLMKTETKNMKFD